MGSRSDLLGEGLDTLLNCNYFLLSLRLSLLGTQLHMPDLATLGRVYNFTGKHIFNALGDALVLGHLVKQGKTLSINFGVRVVEPDFVKNLESECLVSCLILEQVFKMRLFGHTSVVCFQCLD